MGTECLAQDQDDGDEQRRMQQLDEFVEKTQEWLATVVCVGGCAMIARIATMCVPFNLPLCVLARLVIVP